MTTMQQPVPPAGQPITGVQNLLDSLLQVPTVALGIGVGFLVTSRWSRRRQSDPLPHGVS